MKGLLLRASERRELERWLDATSDAALFCRILALLEADAGRLISEVAHLLHVDRRTVQRWIGRYLAEQNVEALRRRPGQGRPPLRGEELEGLLESVLEQRPADFGCAATGSGPCRSWPRCSPVWSRSAFFPARACAVTSSRTALPGSASAMCWHPVQSWRKKRSLRRKIRALPAETALLAQDETFSAALVLRFAAPAGHAAEKALRCQSPDATRGAPSSARSTCAAATCSCSMKSAGAPGSSSSFSSC